LSAQIFYSAIEHIKTSPKCISSSGWSLISSISLAFDDTFRDLNSTEHTVFPFVRHIIDARGHENIQNEIFSFLLKSL
jgi:hypothetical protein